MILGVEDQLGQAVLARLLGGPLGAPRFQVVGMQGKGYLKGRARELNRAATQIPVVLLVDQDRESECPPSMLRAWFGGNPSSNLVCRVARFEVESWLLADAEAIAAFLRVPLSKVPIAPDELRDAKGVLVNLARSSRTAALAADLAPSMGGTARVGPAYNPRMAAFVADRWQPKRAALRSPSLASAIRRLDTLKR
jgi:hypothetical protein